MAVPGAQSSGCRTPETPLQAALEMVPAQVDPWEPAHLPGISVPQPGALSLLPGDGMVMTHAELPPTAFFFPSCHLRVHCSPECTPWSPPVRSVCASVGTLGGREERAPRGRGRGWTRVSPGRQALSFPRETPWEWLSPELGGWDLSFSSGVCPPPPPPRPRRGPRASPCTSPGLSFPIVPGGAGHGTA